MINSTYLFLDGVVLLTLVWVSVLSAPLAAPRAVTPAPRPSMLA